MLTKFMKPYSRRITLGRHTLLLVLGAILCLAPATFVAAHCDCPYVKSTLYGGTGGAAFSDDLTEVEQITKVSVWHGDYVDAIQTTWVLASGQQGTSSRHGGSGGKESSFTLNPDEYITRIEGHAGSYIDQITFYTNQGRKFGPYGGPGGKPFEIEGCVQGFFGSSGSYLDAVGAFSSAD